MVQVCNQPYLIHRHTNTEVRYSQPIIIHKRHRGMATSFGTMDTLADKNPSLLTIKKTYVSHQVTRHVPNHLLAEIAFKSRQKEIFSYNVEIKTE